MRDRSSGSTATAAADAAAHPSPQLDSELLRRARTGDGQAFHELIDRHADRLFRAALCLTPTRADAEDLFQETLLAAYSGLARFDERSSVKTWMSSIMVRQAGRTWRQLKRTRMMRSIRSEASPRDRNSDSSPWTGSAAERTDRRLDLDAVLHSLTPERREVVVLRDLQGLSYDEIACALDIPRGTVESRLYRARLDLRELLSAYAPISTTSTPATHWQRFRVRPQPETR
jgi:RNA polymerase sigma-70 factor (ECF subfamily)